MMRRGALALILSIACCISWLHGEEFRTIALNPTFQNVQPMTGLVLWSTNENVATAPIQLEFTYLSYNQIISGQNEYNFSVIERLLDDIASRKHQAILRFYDTYVGKDSSVPQYIRELPDYRTTEGLSEGKKTGFPDWSHPELQRCILDFYSAFAKKYDRDPRLAFLQVGFGLWSEYHIYDGPMVLGKTFPSLEYQGRFLTHLSQIFQETPWMISIDAADNERTPIEESASLKALRFGLFDDSFNHKRHAKENAPNWRILGLERWKDSPCGGEFSFFEKIDQSKALAPKGPHGIPFEEQARKYHISFLIGDDQLRFQKSERVKEAGMALGYRFRVTKLESNGKQVRGRIKNVGIAPFYYHAFPAVEGIQATVSLKGLLPGKSVDFEVECQTPAPRFEIACQRLVMGQRIEWETE